MESGGPQNRCLIPSHNENKILVTTRITVYTKPLHMEELASIARMGVSTLHHQFRALTAMSPLQYQKQLRLQAARQRMLMDGIDATSAAYEVGYESVSQFSREYSRFFGQPPMRDIKTLRDAKVAAINPLSAESLVDPTPDALTCLKHIYIPTVSIT